MFERYTEKARRVIFFARYEASQWGASHIDTSHMLLALLREDRPLFEKLLGSRQSFENAAGLLGLKLTGEKVSTSIDLPLTRQLRRVLKLAADESKELHNPHITPGHLLLGLLREPSAASMLLEKNGLELVNVRAVLKEMSSVRLELRGLADPDPAPATTNAQIIEQLRRQFQGLTAKLRPEMEPAVGYRLGVEKHK